MLNSDFTFIVVDHKGICDVFHLAKHRNLPYQRSFNKVVKPFELITIKSTHGFSYFLNVVDDHSRYTWLTLMKSKAEVRQHIMNFIPLIHRQHNTLVKTIRTDHGQEFLMPQFYSSKGIVHQTSCVESPQQNGRVERKHQQILNIGRALLFHTNLPKQFLCYVVSHVVFIMNRVARPLLNNTSPYFLMHKTLPDLHYLKVFGSLVYASTLHSHITNLNPRGRKCIFLDYKADMKGCILFDLNNREFFVSRNTKHHDNVLPHNPNSKPPNWTYHSHIKPSSTKNTTSPITHPTAIECPTAQDSPTTNTLSSPYNTAPLNSPQTYKSVRQKRPPSYLADYVCNASNDSTESTYSGTLSYHFLPFIFKFISCSSCFLHIYYT